MAALLVASLGVGSVFAFTPSVRIVDVIIGDRTPQDSLTPGDITTASDVLEGSLNSNLFEFENAFNIFDMVSDEPNGVSGFTSDEDLLYRFTSTPVTPETGGSGAASDNRISINGVTITSAPTTVSLSTPASAELDFVDVEYNGDPDTLRVVGSLTYQFGPGSHPTNTTGPSNVTADVIDINLLTLTVTNQQANSASDEFFVYTVNQGPDAISGNVSITTLDLSAWTYVAALTTPTPPFPGETSGITGTIQPDDDGDSSVSDLNINIPGTSGSSYVYFVSPGGILDFVQNATYRIAWQVSRSAGLTDAGQPDLRLRWAYGDVGFIGGGLVFVPGLVDSTSTSGKEYNVMFDEFDVAAANTVITGTWLENDIQLFFETVDLTGTVGGGAMELDNVEISRFDASQLLGGTVENTVTNWADNAQTALTGGFQGTATNSVTVVRAATGATVTAAAANGAGTANDLFGNPLPVNQEGIGLVPFAPANTSGRFYRTQYGFDASGNSAATPLPIVNLFIQTFNPGPLLTSNTLVQPFRRTGATNPALNATSSFGIYLVVPGDLSGFTGSAGAGVGSQLTASVRFTDEPNTPEKAGSIVVNDITITSLPESILP
jgi:hypothetical protein